MDIIFIKSRFNMKRKKLFVLLLGFFFLVVLQTCVYLFAKEPSARARNPVVVSIVPYQFFVEKISGDTIDVHSLVPPGMDVHTFEPTMRSASLLLTARGWIGVGEPFEKRITDTLHHSASKAIMLNISDHLSLLQYPNTLHFHPSEASHSCSGRDLHVWLSPKLVALQVPLIADSLVSMFPEHRECYLLNAKRLLREMEELNLSLEKTLSPIAGSTFLISHPSLGYFCKDYQLFQLSVETDGKEPLPKDLSRILALAREKNVKLMVVQKDYPDKGAKIIAEQLQIPIYYFDPYQSNYIENLRELANMLRKTYLIS